MGEFEYNSIIEISFHERTINLYTYEFTIVYMYIPIMGNLKILHIKIIKNVAS